MRTVRHADALLLALPLAACAVERPAPLRVRLAGGDGQRAAAGSELPLPIVVRVTDARGRPQGRLVSFVVTAGGGTLFAGEAMSDSATGLATDHWTLGPRLGPGAQRVEVRLVDPVSGRRRAFGAFTATALPASSTPSER